ncbi:MAG: hypothetical protein IKO52_11475 [Clostridia bacterium]|nr:hypothetical protein [Clostridia bacterium]
MLLFKAGKGIEIAATNGSNPCGTRLFRFVAIIPSGHTYATLALQNGVDYKTISNNLGHATVAFTMDVYADVSMTMQIDSTSKMESYIASL